MTATTIPAAAEVRRLRAERDQLAGMLAALLAADAGPAVSLDTARQLAREAYERGREAGWAAGYVACVEDWKRSEHAAVRSAWLVAIHFASIWRPE